MSTKHIPENTVRVSIERVVIPAGHEVIRDRRRVRLERDARAWQFTIPSSRASLGVDDHNVLVETSGAWACCSCAAAVNLDHCTLVDNPAAILRHHGLLPGGPAWPEPYAPAVTDDDRAVAERVGPPADPDAAAKAELDDKIAAWVLGGRVGPPPWLVRPTPPADPGGAVGEPPELAGPTASEDAARDERKRRRDEAMRDLYGDLARDEATLRRGYPSDEVERIIGA